MTRLQNTTYTAHPWRIHEFTADFRIEDTWAFRTPGAGLHDFPVMRAAGGNADQHWLVRFLFATRRELANKTVHTVMHLGWARQADGDHELRMTVLVKPNGTFGSLYLAAIAPFRYLIVYSALTRKWENAWLRRDLQEEER